MKKNRIRIFIALTITCIALLVSGYYILFKSSNLVCPNEFCFCEVRSATDVNSVLQQACFQVTNKTSWQLAARIKELRIVKPGRYKFNRGISNNEIIRVFRSGGEATVALRIDDVARLEELAGKLGKNLLHDSVYFMESFMNDSMLALSGIETPHVACIIRPNTYEFYWNMSAESFLKKMKSESDKLWTPERVQSCSRMSLSREEVVILASIVKAETGSLDEAPKIAGLYLKRLRSGIPLQSDPTAIFGKKTIAQRVYLSDLESDNPYNTYRFSGLPPGPINFPETRYIDAVLEAEEHTYIYMCAEPGGTGKHRFSQTLAEHEKNRRQYIAWLDKQGIR